MGICGSKVETEEEKKEKEKEKEKQVALATRKPKEPQKRTPKEEGPLFPLYRDIYL